MNSRPSAMVSASPILAAWRLPVCSAWWAQVTVVPEVSSVSVLTSAQVERRDRLDPFRRPDRPGLGHAVDGRQRPMVMEQRHLEEDPEPGDEEHHLRGDEQDHPVAQADRDDGRVVAPVRLLHHVAPPADHGVEHAGEPDEEDPRAVLFDAEQPLHEDDEAEGHRGRGDRADQRPAAGMNQMIVVLDGGVGHLGVFRSSRWTQRGRRSSLRYSLAPPHPPRAGADFGAGKKV